MANQAFAKWLQALGEANIDLSDVALELRVALIAGSVYVPNLTDAGHEFLSSIPNGGILGEETILNPTWVARVLDGDDFNNNFPDHGGSAVGDALLIYKHEDDSHAIAAADTVNDRFEVAGDVTADFNSGKKVVVSGSTGNDGTYHVASRTFNNPNTFINVHEDVVDATADGNIITSDIALSRLAFWLDQVTGLPVITDGNDDSIVWNAAGIWRLNV